MSHDNPRGPLPCAQLQSPRELPFAPGYSRGNLPHLDKNGCTFFVTFCLHDAVSGHVRRRHALEDSEPENVAAHSEPSADRGACLLRDQEVGGLVETALLHFQGQRYALHAWVVMPNHAHAIVTPYEGFALADVLHSWKSFTAHQINRVCGRSGRVWQEESFDHAIRSAESFERFVAYTEANPVAAGLCAVPEEWPFSSARFR